MCRALGANPDVLRGLPAVGGGVSTNDATLVLMVAAPSRPAPGAPEQGAGA